MKKFLFIAILGWLAIVALGYYKWTHHVAPKIKAEQEAISREQTINGKMTEQMNMDDQAEDQISTNSDDIKTDEDTEAQDMEAKEDKIKEDTEGYINDQPIQNDEEEQKEVSEPSEDQEEVFESTQNGTDEDEDTSLQMDDSIY